MTNIFINMDKNQRKAFIITVAILAVIIGYFSRPYWPSDWSLPSFKISESKEVESTKKASRKSSTKVPAVLDEFNGVKVYNNGKVSNVSGRNTTKDGYNLGLKYQCVEFVKRYYYERFGHKMPDSYGHAKDFFNIKYGDGAFNKERGLKQYTNPSSARPKKEGLLVYGPTPYNRFGHVAIITKVSDSTVECISQNLGQNNGTRRSYTLNRTSNGTYSIDDPYILGWLSF